jgi:argininosuccinate synthase
VPWLKDTYQRPVITVTVDTGGIDAAAARSLARALGALLGAIEHHLIDARAAYFEQVLKFLIMGNVRRGGLYPLCVGAERVLQAQTIAQMARTLGTTMVAHGCTAAGNDQVRFEVALRTLAPELEISRRCATAPSSAGAARVPRGAPAADSAVRRRLLVNRGLWGVTIGGKETLTSGGSIPDERLGAVEATRSAARAPERHTIGFERGVPRARRRRAARRSRIIEQLETLGRAFGIGRGIHLGDTVIGTKGRVAFEAPAAEVLLTAHRELEKLVLTGKQQRIKESVAQPYGDLVHEGQHLDPVCRDIEALLLSSQARVSGEVHVLLRPGSPVRRGRHVAVFADGGLEGRVRRSRRRMDARPMRSAFEDAGADRRVLPARRRRLPAQREGPCAAGAHVKMSVRRRQDRLGHPGLRPVARAAHRPTFPARKAWCWWSRS